MNAYTLMIGSPDLSSWSLRAWLVLRHFSLPFREFVIELDRPETAAQIRTHSPAGRVPVLKHGPLVIWDSLAIIEYLAERHPEHGIWPLEPAARARARSLAAEMHAGFAALREELPMQLTRAPAPVRRSAAADDDIARILEIWETTRAAHGTGGPFLFGAFTAADAMFAPVAGRFVSFAVPLSGTAADYCQALWSLPAMRAWRRKAGEATA